MKIQSIGQINGAQKLGSFLTSRPIFKTNVADSISFTSVRKVPVEKDKTTVYTAADSLSTSTSGHRAIYGSELFDKNLVKVFSAGIAKYAQEHAAKNGRSEAVVMIGGDTRQATRESLPLIEDVLRKSGVTVYPIKEPVATPLLAEMSEKLADEVDISILLTASHNPWEYGGFNLITGDGAIAPISVTKQVASKIKEVADKGFYYLKDEENQNPSKPIQPYEYYKSVLEKSNLIDFENIRNSGISIYYDSLDGTGAFVVPKLMEENNIPITIISSEGRKLVGPEPNASNLSLLSEKVMDGNDGLKIGLANDGDADRFGIVDSDGTFLTPNEILLLTAYHLHENKGKEGAILRSQVTTSMLDDYAKANNLPLFVTPIGFKYLAEDIIAQREKGKDILVAGEESGGLTVSGHIPEKDGIIAILLMADLMAKEKKPLKQILNDIKKDLNIHFDCCDVAKKFDNDEEKKKIMAKMEKVYQDAVSGKNNEFISGFYIDVEKSQAHRKKMIEYRGNSDGVKLHFTNGSQITVRKSGTEPKVRVHIDSRGNSDEEAKQNCSKLKEQINFILNV